ncbi:MAG: hypothetical protein GX030_05655 [Firmicutes bacterium]|nr:hypothetical protein [Bacillota bacterium]
MACLPEDRTANLCLDQAIYQITLDSMECENGISTWCYTVATSGEEPDLGHWVLGTCADPLPTVLGVTRDGVPLDPDDFEVGTDPLTGVTGIIFRDGIDLGDTVTYCIQIQGCFEPEPQDVSVASGGSFQTLANALCGPSCDPLIEPDEPDCAVCANCSPVDLSGLTEGDGVWCQNLVVLSETITLPIGGTNRTFYVEHRLPFDLLVIRTTT